MTPNLLFQSKELKVMYGLAIIMTMVKLNIGIGFAVGLTASLIHQQQT